VALQADGKILLGGYFTSVNGQPRNRIARLHPDGTVESTNTFNPGTGVSGPGGGGDFRVDSMALQADGKILIAGGFATVNDQPRNNIARLHADGTVESTNTFNPGTGADFIPISVAVQADGKILLGGFYRVDGQTRPRIARLTDDAATQSLTIPGRARVEWARGGAAPEVEQVTFELSTDGGANWSLLGPGTRIAGGWERTGLSLPARGLIRARGRTAGGTFSGTSGMVESVAGFPVDLKITSFSASVPPVGGNGWHIQTTAKGGPDAANALMELQFSESLTQWTTLTTTTADESGIASFDFVDVSGGEKRFYRVRKP